MTRSKSNKRMVVVDGTPYFWRAFEEYDQSHFDGLQVAIMAEDGPPYLKYGLHQPPESRRLWTGSEYARFG